MSSRIALLVLLLLPACRALEDGVDELRRAGERERAGPAGTRQDLARATSAQDAFTAIARLEDARSDGQGMLVLLAEHSDPAVRERAIAALGRLPTWRYGDEITRAIERALDDDAATVRRAAAFALGLRRDARAENALLTHRADDDAGVRAAIVEAASKIATPDLQRLVLAALHDAADAVRIEAAAGPMRFPAEIPAGAPDAAEVDASLLDAVRRAAGIALPREDAATADEPAAERSLADEEVAWRAIASLARRKSLAARELFVRAAGLGESADATEPGGASDGARSTLTASAGATGGAARSLTELADEHARWTRFFATKGLVELAALAAASLADPESASRTAAERAADGLRSALAALASDEDWLVASEAARGLGRLRDARAVDALAAALAHSSAHVRAAAVRALGELAVDAASGERAGDSAIGERAISADRRAELVRDARGDASPTVRSAAIVAHAKIAGASAASELAALASDADPRVRRAVATAATELPSEHAVPLLVPLTADASLFVATEATSALGRHATDAARARLLELLVGEDNGLRLASAEALLAQRAEVGTATIERAWELSTGDIGSETRVMLLRLVDAQPPRDEQIAELLRGVGDPDPYVRLVAHELATERGADAKLPAATDPARSDTIVAPLAPPAARGGNPRVEIVTSRGTLEVELFPTEAPRHVASFLALAARDHYDGLTFHRVEPAFVVQGGCYRGDGNGGGSARGTALRHEIGPRKYRRGSLGMPRSDDMESGGSQIFVTHVPTPHLDGRYTIFGELRAGFDVLDVLEVGDTILDVRVR